MRLAHSTKKWIGTPFSEISCIGFVHAFLEETIGKSVPNSFEDLSVDNYYEPWRENKAAIEARMLEAIKYYCEPHDIRFPKLLDLLVIEGDGRGMMPAIYVGNGNAIACFVKIGVAVFNIDKRNRVVWAGAIK